LNKNRIIEVSEAWKELPFSDQHLLESRLVRKLDFQQIADFLTDVELGQWIPNIHPLYGAEDPPVVKAEGVKRQYETLLAKLGSMGISEEEMTVTLNIE
jgi:hypothetical protein